MVSGVATAWGGKICPISVAPQQIRTQIKASVDHFYADVSGDGTLSPLDALMVINRLAREG